MSFNALLTKYQHKKSCHFSTKQQLIPKSFNRQLCVNIWYKDIRNDELKKKLLLNFEHCKDIGISTITLSLTTQIHPKLHLRRFLMSYFGKKCAFETWLFIIIVRNRNYQNDIARIIFEQLFKLLFVFSQYCR